MGSGEFWTDAYANYLAEHRHPLNRATHFVGIPMLVSTPIAALVLWDWRWAAWGWIVGWIIQLLGHRIEGNRPALLKRPISFVVGPLMVGVEMLSILGIHPRIAVAARVRVFGHTTAG